jgi:hypothetical protein
VVEEDLLAHGKLGVGLGFRTLHCWTLLLVASLIRHAPE